MAGGSCTKAAVAGGGGSAGGRWEPEEPVAKQRSSRWVWRAGAPRQRVGGDGRGSRDLRVHGMSGAPSFSSAPGTKGRGALCLLFEKKKAMRIKGLPS